MRRFSIGLVGESNYQKAIADLVDGDPIDLCHETDNPYDSDAIVARDAEDRTVGYLPRGSWLKDALLREGKVCDATVKSINSGGKELLGVVLDVTLGPGEIEQRAYRKV